MLMNGHYRAETREESRRGREARGRGIQQSGHRGNSGEKRV